MVKMVCVCGFCGNSDQNEGTLEFNFRDFKVYFVCPKCKKMNHLKLEPPHQKLPRIGRV